MPEKVACHGLPDHTWGCRQISGDLGEIKKWEPLVDLQIQQVIADPSKTYKTAWGSQKDERSGYGSSKEISRN